MSLTRSRDLGKGRAGRAARQVAPSQTLGERLGGWWPEILVFLVALGFRTSLLVRLHGSILDGSLVADEQVYWSWSEHILRAGPVGPNPFFMGPLYPYVLALLRLAFGIRTPFGILVVQSVLGSAACAVLTNAARRLTSKPIAAVSGLLVAAYTMAIFHDALILTESLFLFLAAWLVWTAVRASERGCGRVDAIALGATVGLLSQGRGLFALLLIALWPVLRTGKPALLPRRVALAIGAFAIVCAPAAWHNARVSGSLIPFTYNLGMNLYIGNHARASGSWEVLDDREPVSTEDLQGGGYTDGRTRLEREIGHPVGPAESSREWSSRALGFWVDHPAEGIALTARKLAMIVSRHEFPQLESPLVFERLIGFVGLVPFWLLALLALPSLLRRAEDPATSFLLVCCVLLAVGTALFFVVDRYRLHLVPFLVPLAAATLARIARVPRAAILGREFAGIAVAAGLLCLPVPAPTAEHTRWATESDIGDRYATAGRYDAALTWYDRADARVRSGAVTAGPSFTGHMLLMDFEEDVADCAFAAHDTTRAIAALTRASQVAPDPAALRDEVALVLARQGRGGELDEFVSVDRRRVVGFEALGRAARSLATADTATAAGWIEAAVLIDSTGIAPREARIRLAIEMNRDDLVTTYLKNDAPILGPASVEAHRAMLAWQRGDTTRARRCLSSLRAVSLSPPTTEMVDYLRTELSAMEPARPLAAR